MNRKRLASRFHERERWVETAFCQSRPEKPCIIGNGSIQSRRIRPDQLHTNMEKSRTGLIDQN